MTSTTRQVEALRELADALECDAMRPALIGNQLHNLATEIENAAGLSPRATRPPQPRNLRPVPRLAVAT